MTEETRRALGRRLLAIRERVEMSQERFAQTVGCTRSFISYVESGRSAPSAQVVAGVERLGFSSHYLMTGEGEPTRAVEESADHVADRPSFWRELPILGHVPAGRPSMPPNDDLVEGYFSVPRGTVTDPQAFCLRVDGDSMTGVVERGDLVVVSPGARDRVRSRDLVVAMLDDGATVRVYSTAGSRVVLSSANPRYPPVVVDRESGAEIVGKVVGIYHYCR